MAQIVSPKLEESPLPDDPPKKTDPTPDDPTATPEDEPAADPGAIAGEDQFRPEAIAARVDTFGEETEIDRIAREEEKKLHERKKKGKKGLQAAASKRLS